jgi:hypothetical protein
MSRTLRLLGDFVWAALPATFVAAWGAMIWVNQSFDEAPPRRVIVSAAGAEQVSGKRTSYYLTVPGWPDARARRKIRLGRDEYALMSGQPCVGVVWRAGRLGDAWIDGFRNATVCDTGVER